MTTIRTLLVALMLTALAGAAHAWPTYQPPVQIRPVPFGGGYTVQQYGQPTTQIRPMPFGGGYNIQQYGRPTVTCRPMPFGGGVNCN
jgi:hypothetical protein